MNISSKRFFFFFAKEFEHIDKMSFPLTAAYNKFVKAGLIDHLDQHGKAADLPSYVQNESGELAKYMRERLKNEFEKQIKRINENEDSELFEIPGYKGDNAKAFLQEVLSIAKDDNIDGASSALESKTCGQFLACILKII